MKQALLFFVLVLLCVGAKAQDESAEQVKTGWNFGALPTITFDTDLGFQYGALVNLYNYGDGSRYPNYNQSLYFEVSRFTKGSGINRFSYDSDRLIPGIQTTFDLSYLTDQAYDFYGFNGYEAVVNTSWFKSDVDDNSEYISRTFYKYNRKMFRAKLDVQGKLLGNKIRWVTGFNLQNFVISSVDIDELNEGKESDLLPPQNGLYEKYQEWGLISDDEADGGFIPTLKAGVVFDTRNVKTNPMKGVWTEAVVEGTSKIIGSEASFAKFALIHRQYFTIIPDDLAFAYRLAYQTTIGDKQVPFYYQPQVMTSILLEALSEGLGGAKSIRGLYRNRVVGDGFMYGNLEMRWKAVRFRFINNNFYIGLNAFTDFGRVTKKIDIDKQIAQIENSANYFAPGTEKFHIGYGAGLRIVMNQNFVIAADYGRAVDPQDGKSGIYIGLNYLF
ncbi:Omp85 family outer membrane protein [Roseimarinus sediminis]|uniref:Omp85 family outer membrane protein n=1 Tax=Roseimarinus sediminis TaxID=1610899 RepID=UPI003D1CE6AC